MRGAALAVSRSATFLSAFTFVSSRTAARVDPAAPDAGAAACVCAGGALGRLPACCEPITQPAIRPNSTPAIPKATASLFMRNTDHIRAHLDNEEQRGPSGLPEHVEVLANHRAQTDEHRARNNGVSDRDFVEERQFTEDDEVREIEVVSGIDAQPDPVGEACGIGIARERALAGVTAALEGACVRLSVELDAIGADRGGPLNRL